MFEKEAEEYAMKKICKNCTYKCYTENILKSNKLDCFSYARAYKIFKDGAEFGYKKANEWHKVADGDLPSEEGGWVCNQNGLPCFFDWGTEQWLDCDGTQIRTTEWCHMPHKE